MACNFPTDLVIVVGGGLAGVAACNTVVENGGKTVLLDKSSFCGGNSTKATSGINGAATRTQKQKGIEDSTELFIKDTLKGGAKRPEIAKVLCANSGRDVEWLMDAFNLDLSLVARLGGHSAPRTHRGAERFPGMTITYALIQMVEKIAETTDKARIITKAKATRLLPGPDGSSVVGLVYEKAGMEYQEHGPVILCTGGFGADFTADSLLAKYRPDLLHLPTTNGEHCTGDGIKMGEAIGAKSVDLEWVQVHPTGLVKPDDADAKIKFLAAEALRGVGGIILNNDGKRFCNELGRRDYVTGEMWKSKPPFRLCLNKAASDEIIWHCKHYTGRGVMKYYASGEALAQDMGVPLSVIEEAHQAHYEAAKKTEKDPDGGEWPAYPSGKSWDAASGPTGSGKKFYHNIIPGDAVKTEPYYVAIITPVIHYCMGGLEIDADGLVMGNNAPIKGLYCAGEVAGGVHGNNRLGGNSLLDCVVFGRVTGEAATKYILGDDVQKVDLKELTKGGLTGEVKGSKLAGGSYEDGMNEKKGGDAKAKTESGAATATATGGREPRPTGPLNHRRVFIIGGSFCGLVCARDLTHNFLVTVVDAKEFFEYTPGVLRAFVKPKHLDALTFTLQPVVETKMHSKLIWGEVMELDGNGRTALLKPMFAKEIEMIDFDFCIIAAGCNFGPFHKWGESLWFPTIHEAARPEGSWPHLDERFLEGRRRHILEEYCRVKELHDKKATCLVVGAGFIGVEWATEINHFFPDVQLTIIDFLPNCLGPLPKKAADYCSNYMKKQGMKQFYNKKYDKNSKEFWQSIELPNGPDKEYVCIGVKASNYFMPKETLSEKGPGGGGWILMDLKLAVKTREGAVWGADHKGQPRIFAVGDCNYSCVEEPGKKPDEWPIPPMPKISYPGEEEAVIACGNLEKVDKIVFQNRSDDCCGKPVALHDMHWPWGAGMFATSLGPDDACFVAGANWVKNSGYMVTWGSVAAVQKEIIEATITDEAQYGLIGRLIWHFVHHTPIHLFGGGPVWGYTW